MNVVVGRREFLGSAAIVGVGSMTAGPLLVEGAGKHSHHTGGHIEQELVDQLRTSLRGMQGARPAEGARQLASTLRLAAAHFKEKEIDADLKAFLHSTIRNEGRESLLRRQIDKRMLAAEMQKLGVTAPLDLGPVDHAMREKALDMLLTTGLTPLMTRVADTLDRRSETLDRRETIRLSSAQEPEQPACPDLSSLLSIMDMTLLVACLFMQLACVVVSAMWFGLNLSLLIACWGG
ncbi:MAG TPA: hypothetical protein VFO58_12420 [Vicinamibacterales bacterium]|nr:hypothetical protein [Vicinamibacterales bacterium]